ncbi:MAG: hypothetical protein EKK62_16825 [Acidimicrobiia bacterium]|nr:MAG: hypothetical protein EKK62_16825 [Acidimicrobiia bacterium]
MPFSADAWRAGRQAWSYTEGGRTWEARPVSALAVADTLTGLDRCSPREQAARWRALFRLAFPWSPLYLALPQYDPVRRIMALEPGAYQAVIVDFLLCLGLGDQTTSALATSGTSSSMPTSPETP